MLARRIVVALLFSFVGSINADGNFLHGMAGSHKFIGSVAKEYSELKSIENTFESSSVVNGFTMVVACSLIISAAFFGGCLVCPTWGARKSILPKTSSYVGNIDLGNIQTSFSKDQGVIVHNKAADLENAITKIITDNILVHSNPCFSLDEMPCKKNSSNHSMVSNTYLSSTSPLTSEKDLDYLVYENVHFQRNDQLKPFGSRRQLNKQNRTSTLSVVKCSDNYDLYGFYNKTEYLNKTYCDENGQPKRLFIHSKRPKQALKDVSNCYVESVTRFENRTEKPKLLYDVTHSCACSDDLCPGVSKRFCNMNDIAFQNLFAK